jgi:hypothetical protein
MKTSTKKSSGSATVVVRLIQVSFLKSCRELRAEVELLRELLEKARAAPGVSMCLVACFNSFDLQCLD